MNSFLFSRGSPKNIWLCWTVFWLPAILYPFSIKWIYLLTQRDCYENPWSSGAGNWNRMGHWSRLATVLFFIELCKGNKRSSKPLFTSFKINKTEFHIIATLRLTRGHYEPIIRSINVCSLFFFIIHAKRRKFHLISEKIENSLADINSGKDLLIKVLFME